MLLLVRALVTTYAFGDGATAFVEAADKLSPKDRLTGTREPLAVLYAAGTRLPDIEKVTDQEAPTHPVPERWPGFQADDSYWEVFDPYERFRPC